MRNFPSLVVAAACLLLASAALAAPVQVKRHTKVPRHWHSYGYGYGYGYGFLPGVRSPERIEWERAREWARNHGPVYWWGSPRFYRGRWNGGGFGPCWTPTPIGPIWNCGK